MSERNPYETDEQREEHQAQQEQYYWHCLHEFVAICKVFGMEKVSKDIKLIREQLEGIKEESRIITL